jgi:Ni,Fe-hydrogenase III small subunit
MQILEHNVSHRGGFMKASLLLLLTLVTLSESAHADAIKCRMPNGKVVITDGACSGGASVEQVRPSEYPT